jgi:hypothetical protein
VPVIPLPEPELSDGVVRLRPPQTADDAALIEACRDPLVQRFMLVPSPYEAHDAHESIVDVETAAGLRVAGRAGFLREAIRQDAIEANGRRWTLETHSLRREHLGDRP